MKKHYYASFPNSGEPSINKLPICSMNTPDDDKCGKKHARKKSSFFSLLVLSSFLFTQVLPANSNAQTINTIAGNGTVGYSGDGGAASAAVLDNPSDLYVDPAGNIYFSDNRNDAVRKINTSGVISNVYSGGMFRPRGIVVGKDGNVYFSTLDNKIFKVDKNGTRTVVGGNGGSGFSGDGGQATAATIWIPQGVTIDTNSNLYFVDQSNYRVRRIDKATGIITTVVGNGTSGSGGDGGPGTAAQLNSPSGIAIDAAGKIYIADNVARKVRKYDPSTGIITTVVGTGGFGNAGDGGPATAATLGLPERIAFDGNGDMYITDWGGVNQSVRKVNMSTGIITKVAGSGTSGFSGDGGPATVAVFNTPYGVGADATGNFFVADRENNRIRKVCLGTTPAGTPTLSASPGAVCLTGMVTLSVSSGSLNNSSSWSWYSGSCGGTFIGTGISVVVTPTITTTYYARGEGTCSGAGSCGSITVTVNTTPAITGNTSLSVGFTSALSNATTGGTWTSGNLGVAVAGSSTGVVTGISAGTAIVTYIVNECPAITAINVLAPSPALHFDTSQPNKINTIGNVLSSGSSYTKEAWVNVIFTSAGKGIISTADAPFWIAGGHLAAANNYVSSGSNVVVDTADFPYNQWVHVAVTYNSSTSTMTLYKNGQIVATTSSSPSHTSGDMYVATNASTQPFKGTMDEVRIWNIARTQSQIQASMNCDIPQQSGLVAYYRFDEGTPADDNTALGYVVDYSGNSHCGQLSNFELTGSTSNYVTGAVGNCNAITISGPAAIQGPGSVCVGSTITLTNDSTGGVWTASGTRASINVTTGVVTGNLGGSSTINYRFNCRTVTKSISINSLPTVSAGSGVAICNGSSTTLTASGGSTYVWSPSTGLSATTGSSVTATPTSTTTYTVAGANSNGCTNTATKTVTVNPLYAIAATAGSNGSISPSGSSNVCSGNNQAYTITATSGYHVADVMVDGSSVGAVTTYTFTAVSATHSISATFAPDCTAPTVSASATNATCYGGSNGSLTATASGTATLSYSWTGGATTSSVSGVAAGTYTVTVTNACGSASATATVGQPSAITFTATTTQPTCSYNTGSVSLVSSGGTGTISYSGSATAGLTTGSYSYTATDANGCTITAWATITNPSAISFTATATQPACSYNTGSVSLASSGGTGTITYSGSATTGLATGSYSYTATDANGCTTTAGATITNPSAITFTATATQPTCSYNTGSVALASSGGTGSISYSGSATTGLTTGSYSYTATDFNGCTATASASITNPSAISFSATATQPTCSYNAGSVTLASSGGTGTISYSGSATTGLNTGSYSYTATDANGCTATAGATITNPSAINISTSATNISCNSTNGGNHSNGSIATTVSGGAGSYSYSWTGGASGANPTGLSAGTYTVTVSDASSCTVNAAATVGQPSSLTVTASVTNVSCNSSNSGNHNNGSITASADGGNASYSYAWSNSVTGATTTGLSAGTYSVTVTDANSCMATTTGTVGEPSAISSTITGSTTTLGAVAYTYSGPSGMATYNWTLSGGDHVCDSKCHHYTGHSCGSGCDHYSASCNSSCHHHGSHSCTNNHRGDHHCSYHCHHHSGHSCASGCDHNGRSCNSACHHHSSHRCGHTHCGNPTISGSTTGSSINVMTPCCASTYTLTLTTTNSAGCSSTSTLVVTATATATITVYSQLYTTGSGSHPSTTKTAMASSLKVFTRSTSRRRNGNQSNYSTVWNSTTGQVTNVSISSPTTVNMGGGPAYRYTITVPANGHYLVIGQSVVASTRCGGTTCTIYTGKKLGGNDDCDGSDEHGRDDDDDDDLDACSEATVRFHSVIKDQSGRCREGDTHQEHGSLMLVVAPMELDFDDTVSYLPIVYESVEGDWSVSVTADPPYGFYTVPDNELSTSITDSVMNAVQFAVIDTGSEWTFTKLTHAIQHKGEGRIAYSKPVMINERTNRPSQVNIVPNPASEMITVELARFEGSATIKIYNQLGQQVAEKPVHIVGGETFSMDISKLVPGVYMVTVENTSGKATGRLIKAEK